MTALTVKLTPADQARDPYYYVPVQVPEETTRIDLAMRYNKAEDCVIDLGMFDPRMTAFPSAEGFRGWSGGARDRFFIATDDATPGYVHGPIPAGTWNIILGLYKVPAEGAEVTLTFELDAAPRRVTEPPVRIFPVRQGAGWYRGDLHCHTFHSDARGAPEILHAAARQAGLDFLAVADHNTVTQRRYFHPHSSADLVFVRAMEITTAAGHANVFGVDDWIDFRMRRPADGHIVARLVHEKGGLLSINHDKPTIPWDYELPDADCQEIWQSSWMAWNWVSLGRWQARLASGLKISAIGGSDFHQPETLQAEGPLVLARPTTVLWLPQLSEDAILAAMKAGRGYVTEAPDGPHLELRVDGVPMGGVVSDPRLAHVHVRGAVGDLLHWIDATGLITEIPIDADDWFVDFTVPNQAKKFLRCEVVAQQNRARLIEGFIAAVGGPDRLPWQLGAANLADQPIRRAIGNPVYFA